MSDPLNKPGSVKFFLDFKDGTGDQQIAELWGWDGAIFELLQDGERLGRDIFFAKTELGFRSTLEINGLNHRFAQLMERYDESGFESDILFILTIDGDRFVVGELDFVESVTDGFSYFNCKVIQEAEEVALKRKQDVNIDLFSTSDTSNNALPPVATSLLLWKAIPLKQESSWQQPGPFIATGGSSSGSGSGKWYVSPTTIPIEQNIEDTIYPENFSRFGEFTDIIVADSTLVECKLSIQTSEVTLFAAGSANGYSQAQLRIQIGTDIDNIFQEFRPVLLNANEGNSPVVYPDTLLEFEFSVPRDQRVFVHWFFDVQTGNAPFTGQLNIPNSTIKAVSTSLSISSVVTAVRFIDAFRQVVKSIGNYSVVAPRFDSGGEYYEQWITNGKLLRQIENEPFNVSLKSLLLQLKEIDGDYQIVDTNTLFLGIYEDFYQDIDLVGQSLLMAPNTTYQQIFSDRYTINEVKLRAKKYEEDTNEQGSRFGIHSEIDVLLPNKRAENSKDIVVEYIRDGFLIEKVRKEAVIVDEDTASIDDEQIMIIDGIYDSQTFAEYMLLIQIASSVNTTDLSLINDNSFNWTLLGMVVGQNVAITGGENQGIYTVITIEPNVLTVRRNAPQAIVAVTSVALFTYAVEATELTQRIGEGFQEIGLPFFANGIFSNKRVLRKYYGSYMRSAALYLPNDIYLTQRYIHNAAWVSKLDTEQFPIIEGENIDPTVLDSPLVFPLEITTEVIAEFSVYWTLMQGMRSERGYVTVQDNLGNDIKIFPSSLVYNWGNNLLTIVGLKKYEL